ncbi:MAG: MATE family efflux transporter [Ruminococcus sp.]
MLNKKDFLKYASTLAFPIMIQNLISTLVNIADTVMLGYVSQTAMSASSLANQYTFILFCLYYGMATGTSVLCAQYWGKGDQKTVEKILGLAERCTLIISLIFFLISFSMPTTVMKIFTDNPDTIAAGSEYLRVLSFSLMFMGFSQVFMSALRSIGKIMLPSVTYIVSLCVNVLCNATFIFGLFGLPKLGVTGVALGTVIARIAEVLICLIYSLNKSNVRFRIKYFFAKSGILFQIRRNCSLRAVITTSSTRLCQGSAFAAILGHIGNDMVAANAVAVMVVNIGAIACRGFANATTIIISQELGKNHIDTAREYGKRMLRITIIVSLIGCAVILAIRPLILDFYRDKLTETAIYYLGVFIIMTTWRLVGEGINTCLICGCFRGGGDSRFGMIVDSIFMWLVAVPLTFLAAYVFKLPPIWVYFVMSLDELEKMPVVFIHYFRRKWLTNITRDFD